MNERTARAIFLDRFDRDVYAAQSERIVFRCEKSIGAAPNIMMVKVYSPKEREVQAVLTRAVSLQLMAGIDQLEMIGSGTLVSARNMFEDGNVYLSCVTIDGEEFLESKQNNSISKGASLYDIAVSCIRASGTGVGYITPRLREKTMPRGVSVLQNTMGILKALAASVDAFVFYQDNLVYIVCNDELTATAISIDENDISEFDDMDGQRVQIRTNINGRIRPGFSSKIRGKAYRILKTISEGDTKNNLWQMTCIMEQIPD